MATNLDMSRIPEHIAIIMDGNGRWAMERGKERSFGHQAGVDTVRRITSECTRLGVKYLTHQRSPLVGRTFPIFRRKSIECKIFPT